MREASMTTIGILSEGRTDQKVIEQVLLGSSIERTLSRSTTTERNIEIREG
jgi:hypothetical protein